MSVDGELEVEFHTRADQADRFISLSGKGSVATINVCVRGSEESIQTQSQKGIAHITMQPGDISATLVKVPATGNEVIAFFQLG